MGLEGVLNPQASNQSTCPSVDPSRRGHRPCQTMVSSSPTLISDTPILVSGFLSSIFRIRSLRSSLISGLGRGEERNEDATTEEGPSLPSQPLSEDGRTENYSSVLALPLKAEMGPSQGKCSARVQIPSLGVDWSLHSPLHGQLTPQGTPQLHS